MNALFRGHICRTEPEPRRGRTTYDAPLLSCQEQDEAAEAYARFWLDFHAREGRAPGVFAALDARLPHIRTTVVLQIVSEYCHSAGMLPAWGRKE
jgi:hypothetical protein